MHQIELNSILVSEIMLLKLKEPKNLMAKNFNLEYYKSLSPDLQTRFLKSLKILSGIKESEISINDIRDYDLFREYYEKLVVDYYASKGQRWYISPSNFDLSSEKTRIEGLGFKNQIIDLTKLSIPPNSRSEMICLRNIKDLALNNDDNTNYKLEQILAPAIDALINHKGFGGNYYSFLENSKYLMTDVEYKELQDEKIITGGIGVYCSKNLQTIIKVNEYDHLKIICKGAVDISELFSRIKTVLKIIDDYITFSKTYFGYGTRSPLNLGSALTIIIYINIDPKMKLSQKHIDSVLGKFGVQGSFKDDCFILETFDKCCNEAKLLCSAYEACAKLLEIQNYVEKKDKTVAKPVKPNDYYLASVFGSLLLWAYFLNR